MIETIFIYLFFVKAQQKGFEVYFFWKLLCNLYALSLSVEIIVLQMLVKMIFKYEKTVKKLGNCHTIEFSIENVIGVRMKRTCYYV